MACGLLVTIGRLVGANTGTVMSLSKWNRTTSVCHCESSSNFLLLWLNGRIVLKWESVGCWLMEEAVPYNNVAANDDFFSKLILATDAVGKKSTFKDVGTTIMYFSLVLISELPTSHTSSCNQCLETQRLNCDSFSIRFKFLILLWIITAK